MHEGPGDQTNRKAGEVVGQAFLSPSLQAVPGVLQFRACSLDSVRILRDGVPNLDAPPCKAIKANL